MLISLDSKLRLSVSLVISEIIVLLQVNIQHPVLSVLIDQPQELMQSQELQDAQHVLLVRSATQKN